MGVTNGELKPDGSVAWSAKTWYGVCDAATLEHGGFFDSGLTDDSTEANARARARATQLQRPQAVVKLVEVAYHAPRTISRSST